MRGPLGINYAGALGNKLCWGPCGVDKQKRMNESSAVLQKMASKGFGMALESLQAQHGQKAHTLFRIRIIL